MNFWEFLFQRIEKERKMSRLRTLNIKEKNDSRKPKVN